MRRHDDRARPTYTTLVDVNGVPVDLIDITVDATVGSLDITGPLGRRADAASLSMSLSTENMAVIDGLETAIASTNTKLDTAIGLVDGVESAIASTNAKLDTVIGYADDLETLVTSTNTKIDSNNSSIGAVGDAAWTSGSGSEIALLKAIATVALSTAAALVRGWGFSVAVNPTVTSGAYSANDLVGGLLTFADVAVETDRPFNITGAQIVCKSAVTLTGYVLIIFSADPTATTKTDNAAYSLNSADAFKPIATIKFTNGVAQDHGTPNSIRVDGEVIAAMPVSGTRNIVALLLDSTGVTLGSTSDLQIRLRGNGP